MKIVALVGMPGSGKTEAVKFAVDNGFYRVYFGDITMEAVKEAGLPINEANERSMREQIRKAHGMDAYAKLSLPKIEEGLRKVGKVVIESMYSFEEYMLLKKKFGNGFIVIAIYASPKVRYSRLGNRPIRPLTPKECESRDVAQLENLHQGGPIAMADFTIINEGSFEELERSIKNLIESFVKK